MLFLSLFVDFGLGVLEEFMGGCTFPWLLSNVLDKCTNKPMAGALDTWLLDLDGVSVGLCYSSPMLLSHELYD